MYEHAYFPRPSPPLVITPFENKFKMKNGILLFELALFQHATVVYRSHVCPLKKQSNSSEVYDTEI